MNPSARICTSCRKLNSRSEARCFSCGAPLSGVLARLGAAFRGANSATLFLLGLCIFNFAILVLINGSVPVGLFGPRAGRLPVLGVGGVAGGLALAQPWRLLSANYVHLSLLHLGMNLYALYSIGRTFEARFGGVRLILVYSISGVSAFLLSSFLYSWSGPLTAGASAALFGMLGAEFGFLAIRRDPSAREMFFQNLFLAAALAILMPVNNFAHLGGFLAGLVLGAALTLEKRTICRELGLGILATSAAAVALISIFVSLYLLHWAEK